MHNFAPIYVKTRQCCILHTQLVQPSPDDERLKVEVFWKSIINSPSTSNTFGNKKRKHFNLGECNVEPVDLGIANTLN